MEKNTVCSFCNSTITIKDLKEKKNYVFLGSNNEITICKQCVEYCHDILKKEISNNTKQENIPNKVSPKAIKNELDKWIIGQEEAKKTLSIALYNHYIRINQPQDINPEDKIEKSNIVLVGSTGSGKTASCKALARIMDLPFVIEDVTSISSTGYVGRDTEDILKNLISAADGDIEKAQNGIVLLDEGDKLKKEKNTSGARDVKGEGVQQGLLKIVEGGVFDVKTKKGVKKFDTSNVLFILGGAFEGIDKVIEKRLNKNNKSAKIGFTTEAIKPNVKESKKYNELIVQVKHEDLKEFGMMSELLGRFPVLTALEELSEEALISILTEPKNSLIKQYQKMFDVDNIELEFSKEALYKIAKEAKERKIGARALRSIVEEVLKNSMYEVPGTNINKIYIDENLNAIYSNDEEQLKFEI